MSSNHAEGTIFDADAPVRSTPITTPPTLPGPAGPYNNVALVGGSLALAVLLALISVLFARRRAAVRGTDILFVGPSDGGKTALFARLVYGRSVRTHASMQPNIAALPGSRMKLRVVDLPGHARLRAQGLQDHLPRARGILFIVDASTVARTGAAVAEHMHEVMHALAALPATRPPPLAVLATKADLAGGVTTAATRVRTVLERELDKRRAARVDVDTDADTLGGLETVGAPGSPFRLADWDGGEIRVFAGSAVEETEKTSEKDTLAEVREWMDTLE